MASDGQTWQDGMSLVECNEYMLSNSVSTDVTFIVGENRKQVLAHKYVLGSRSSVFYAMLFGPMAETSATITIPDIASDIFEEILRYFYYEEVLITLENVTSLVLAADKYNIIGVLNRCSNYLYSCVTVQKVCKVLDIAVTLQNEELKNKCLDFVFNNSEVVLKSSSIYTVQQESLKLIIQADELNASETLVYKTVKKWAETQCKTNDLDVCDSNIRAMLGEMISLIRFTIMDKDHFAKIVSTSNILSLEEKVKVFQVHRGVSLKEKDIFCGTNLRIRNEFARMDVAMTKIDENYVSQKLSFMVTEEVKITGYEMCASLKKNAYRIQASLSRDGESLDYVKTTCHTTEGEPTVRVMFKSGVCIKPKIWYTAEVNINGPISLSCYRKSDSSTVENVTFIFEKRSNHFNMNSYMLGIVFRNMCHTRIN